MLAISCAAAEVGDKENGEKGDILDGTCEGGATLWRGERLQNVFPLHVTYACSSHSCGSSLLVAPPQQHIPILFGYT